MSKSKKKKALSLPPEDTRLKVGASSLKLTNVKGNVTGPVLSGTFHAPVQTGSIQKTDEIDKVFMLLWQKADSLPEGPNKDIVQSTIRGLIIEARKGENAEERAVSKLLNILALASSDIWELAITTFVEPIAGLNLFFRQVAEASKHNNKTG